MEEAGQKLKRVRERLRLKFRDVEEASARIAARHGSDEFIVALSRLADIENKGTMPSVYRLYSLCAIYRLEMDSVQRMAKFRCRSRLIRVSTSAVRYS
jgi:transcriptional regulator with XRE-family HTH domain